MERDLMELPEHQTKKSASFTNSDARSSFHVSIGYLSIDRHNQREPPAVVAVASSRGPPGAPEDGIGHPSKCRASREMTD